MILTHPLCPPLLEIEGDDHPAHFEVTPQPTGDMTPHEIQAEGGNDIILSGGVSPVFWSPDTSERDFTAHVREWLDLRKISPRLIMSDGDQTPPGTSLGRIKLMREIVEEFGRYDRQ